jgi:hypothetical protein
MKVRVLLTTSTENLLWARTNKPLIAAKQMDSSEVVVELEHDVLEKCFERDCLTLDEAIRQIALEGEH